jgi:GNAT superfamily N-acetyltransferase
MSPRETQSVSFHFRRPEEIPEATLDEIRDLVKSGGAVGASWIAEMLRTAFLIGYATAPSGRVVGCEVLKTPKETYRRKIEAATGLDLSGYLERGYAAVAEGYRGRGILDRIVRELVEQGRGRKTYVTASMDNHPVIRLTEKHGMRLAGRYTNPATGNEIGVFINRRPQPLPAGVSGRSPAPPP